MTVSFKKIGYDLGTVTIGAELTRLGVLTLRSRIIFFVSLTWLLTWRGRGMSSAS